MFFFLILMMVAFGVGRLIYLNNQRQIEIKQFAHDSGLSHGGDIKYRIRSLFSDSVLFRLAEYSEITNTFEAESDGLNLTCFDLAVGAISGANSIVNHTVISVESESLTLPPFAILPFKAFHGFRSRIELPKIVLPSDPVLSSMFSFFGTDSELVDASLNEDFRDFIRRQPNIYFESTNQAFLVCYPLRKHGVGAMKQQLSLAYKLHQILVQSQSVKRQCETVATSVD